LQEYYSKKIDISTQNLTKINWAALRIARDKLQHGQRTFSIKFAIRWLATGSRMKMQGRILTECKRCGEEETTDHLYQCPHRAEIVTDKALAFERFLSKINTDDNITKALITGFKNWALIQNNPQDAADKDILRDLLHSRQSRVALPGTRICSNKLVINTRNTH
jgi:hypothetical protein